MTWTATAVTAAGQQWAILLGGALGAGVGVPVGRWTVFLQLRGAPVARRRSRVAAREWRRRRRMRVRAADRRLLGHRGRGPLRRLARAYREMWADTARLVSTGRWT